MASTSQDNENSVSNNSAMNTNVLSTENKDETVAQSKVLKLNLNSSNVVLLQNENVSPVEELLGSVTTFNNSQGGSEQALRTSARVIKKLQQDSLVVNNNEKDKKDVKIIDKIDNKPKPKQTKASWSVIEKNLFFEALNEFGKDFESVTQYISGKMKRRGVCDNLLKNKDQVRHFYYRTFNKISKFITFNSDLKKNVQELYLLINYGEMRKKIFLINEKTALKLSELIYRGSVPLRMKGKTFRIKTPMCRALRKLNEMEEWQDELKLPSRVLVILQPGNVEAWHRVQSVAHNPRVTALLPIQRRLSNLLSILNDRWKSYDTKLLQKLSDIDKCMFVNKKTNSKVLHFGPKAGVNINKPIINLSEYITSNRICLNSYEDRVGITEKSETIFSRTVQSFKGGGSKKGNKRQRSDSGGDKKTTDGASTTENVNKKGKFEGDSSEEKNKENTETPGTSEQPILLDLGKDIVINPITIDANLVPKEECCEKQEVKLESSFPVTSQKAETKPKVKEKIKIPRKKTQSLARKRLDKETEEKIQDIFKYGWTIDDAANVTFGDLYLMFGSNSKIQMEYWWDCVSKPQPEETKSDTKIIKNDIDQDKVSLKSEAKDFSEDAVDQNENISKNNGEVYKSSDVHLLLPHKTELATNNELSKESKEIEKATDLTRRLKQLLVCLQTNNKTKKNTCTCGHVCNDKPSNDKKSNSNKSLFIDSNNETIHQSTNIISQRPGPSSIRDNSVFRQPFPITSNVVDNFEKQINSMIKIKPRWNNRQNRFVGTKKVVQRMLPLGPNPLSGNYVNLNYSQLGTNMEPQHRIVASRQLNFGADAAYIHNRKLESRLINDEIRRNSSIAISNNKQNFYKPKPIIKTSNSTVSKVEYKATSTVSKVETKPTETVVKSTPETNEIDNDNKITTDLIDDFSIGSSTIAEAQASIIRNDQLNELLDTSRALNTPENTWFNADLHDFSLSSFLGHLESPDKSQTTLPNLEETKLCQDAEVNMQSLLNENSEDYMAKFAALAARMSNESSNK